VVEPVQDIPTPTPPTEVAPYQGSEGSGEIAANPRDAAESAGGESIEPPPPLRTEFRAYDRDPVSILARPPVYPEIARDAGVEGRVVVALLIDRTGHVRDAVIERSVPMLDGPVLEATRLWTYEPALIGNRPAMAWIRIPFDFRLH
jgi:protein TonB